MELDEPTQKPADNEPAINNNVTIPTPFKGFLEAIVFKFGKGTFSVYDIANNFSGVGTHDDLKETLEFMFSVGVLKKTAGPNRFLYQVTADAETIERMDGVIQFFESRINFVRSLQSEILLRYDHQSDESTVEAPVGN